MAELVAGAALFSAFLYVMLLHVEYCLIAAYGEPPTYEDDKRFICGFCGKFVFKREAKRHSPWPVCDYCPPPIDYEKRRV